MELNTIEKNIEHALDLVYRVDAYLIEKEAHEQAISARIMLHLQHLFPEWNVDVEYNRQGENINPKKDADGHNRKPDIIIHKRGPRGPNLAIILVKCKWNTQDRSQDEFVVSDLKTSHNYQSAFLIEINKDTFEIIRK
jgi:hypothetical protein